MNAQRLSGCGTALVTPFTKSGEIDERSLRSFVDWQIASGVHFVVPCGSTGEAATMTIAEHRRVVEITVEQTAGRVPVVAGAASNDTQKAIALSREMESAGATHLLHASPMYNKPPQRGIVAHFLAIADAVQTPIVVYNVPARTASNIEAATTLELAEHENIVAVKEASGNLSQVAEVIRHRPARFSILSAEDPFPRERGQHPRNREAPRCARFNAPRHTTPRGCAKRRKAASRCAGSWECQGGREGSGERRVARRPVGEARNSPWLSRWRNDRYVDSIIQ